MRRARSRFTKGTGSRRHRRQRPIDEEELDRLVAELGSCLSTLPAGAWAPDPVPFLLILDTLEEIQIAGRFAVLQVTGLVRRMQEHYPRLRVVYSGRAREKLLHADELALSELEPATAMEVLEAHGVDDVDLRKEIVKVVGGSPLSLFLAATIARREGREAFDGLRTRGLLMQKLEAAEIQGQLYDRIVKHIHDPRLRKLAHPGLVLRRLTPELIAGVLAGPCEIEPESAPELFESMSREVSLVIKEPGGGLRHRSDVRKVMPQHAQAQAVSGTDSSDPRERGEVVRKSRRGRGGT